MSDQVTLGEHGPEPIFDFIERVMRQHPNEWIKVCPIYGDLEAVRLQLGARFSNRWRGEEVRLASRNGDAWAIFLEVPTVLGEQPKIFAL